MADKNKILLLGSIAYDHVMKFDGVFKDIIVPNNYNIAITAKTKNIFFGGCAGNIAYSLHLLGQQPSIVTVAGRDFGEYKQWMISNGIEVTNVYASEKLLTATAIIVTDDDQNQITVFNPGAMYEVKTTQSVKLMSYGEVAWAIISPENPERMMVFAHECKELKIPFIFDPGQVLPALRDEDIMWGIKNADVFIINDYESALLTKKLGFTDELIGKMVPTYIQTHGEKGSTVKSPTGMSYIRAVQPAKITDPTGCGDAYRAGLLAGLREGKRIEKCCQAGALMATYVLESEGTQNHKCTLDEFSTRLENNFGER